MVLHFIKRGLIAASCRSQNRCFKCKGKRNSAICHEQIFEQRKKEKETETRPKDPEKKANLRADSTNSMLLQTAQVLICHPADERKVIHQRAVFDSGSHRSYILEGTKQQLNLPTVAKEDLVVNEFGNSHGTAQSLSSVSIIIKNAQQ